MCVCCYLLLLLLVMFVDGVCDVDDDVVRDGLVVVNVRALVMVVYDI